MDLDTDGPFLFPALDEASVNYDVVAWDDPRVKWKSYSAVVLRACWDYFRRPDEFREVLDQAALVTRLENPLEVVEWNIDKRYLTELRKAGLPTVATAYVSHLSPPTELGSALAQIGRWGSAEVVVKPTISAGSNDTFRIDAADGSAVSKAVQSIVDSDRVAMIQPFLTAVDEEGERGAVYLNGAFAHSFSRKVTLTPDGQDSAILSAPETVDSVELTTSERMVADRVNSWLTSRFAPLLYARVDLLPSPEGPQIVEVELIEPSLFFEAEPASAQRFALALADLT